MAEGEHPELAELESSLRAHTRSDDSLVRPEADNAIRCVACAHRCLIREGRPGICRVRFNDGGHLLVPWGYCAGLAADPIEKKPFYHVLPGRSALSFGMLGCNLHCSFCQNWFSSQTLRDESAAARLRAIDAERIVELAIAEGTPAIVSTYNEPLISAEWSAEIFDLAKRRGLLTGYVSNGYATPEVLDYLAPRLDLFKVDLKTFDDREYRRLGGVLERVLAGIEGAVDRGLWVEIVTLIVPGLNDDEDQLRRIAEYVAGVSVDIPWHVTAFHPDYKMTDRPRTQPASLKRAVEAGRRAGLNHVYPGNLAGAHAGEESTRCPGCKALIVERRGWQVRQIRIRDGACPECSRKIPGVWD